MDEKSTLKVLADALAQRHDMETEHAEAFVSTFFHLIEEGLQTDRYVKIKGLGTFKLIAVDARESVDVNTGERIQIEAHNRITFTPENSLKEWVNKPFSHFETVVLHDETRFDDLPIEENEDVGEEEWLPSPDVLPALPSTAPDIPMTEETEDVPTLSAPVAAVSATAPSEQPLEPEAEVPTPTAPARQMPDYSTPVHRRTPPWCMYATILFCGILIGGLAAWLIMSGRRYVVVSELRMPNPQPQPTLTPVLDTLRSDSLPTETAATLARDTVRESSIAASEVPAEVTPVSPPSKKKETISDTVKYRMAGTMQTYTIQEGESLVRIALKFYGNKKLWPYLVQYNKEIIKNPDRVPSGTTIKIPKLLPR